MLRSELERYTHACARARARTHTHTRTHARTYTHTHTHTHTHICFSGTCTGSWCGQWLERMTTRVSGYFAPLSSYPPRPPSTTHTPSGLSTLGQIREILPHLASLSALALLSGRMHPKAQVRCIIQPTAQVHRVQVREDSQRLPWRLPASVVGGEVVTSQALVVEMVVEEDRVTRDKGRARLVYESKGFRSFWRSLICSTNACERRSSSRRLWRAGCSSCARTGPSTAQRRRPGTRSEMKQWRHIASRCAPCRSSSPSSSHNSARSRTSMCPPPSSTCSQALQAQPPLPVDTLA